MSDAHSRRLEVLRLTKPAASMPDMAAWLAMADQLDAWICSEPKPEPIETPKPSVKRKA